MLLNNFYTAHILTTDEQLLRAQISLVANHPILQGHFPQQAVVPGVCMLTMVKELLENHTQKKLCMHDISVAKFLQPWTPENVDMVDAHIQFTASEEQSYLVDAILCRGEQVFLKCKGKFLQA